MSAFFDKLFPDGVPEKYKKFDPFKDDLTGADLEAMMKQIVELSIIPPGLKKLDPPPPYNPADLLSPEVHKQFQEWLQMMQKSFAEEGCECPECKAEREAAASARHDQQPTDETQSFPI